VPYVVYELIEGARELDEVFRLSALAERCALVLQAARALGHAHERGVVHRDAKPANMLVDGQGTVRILDFGIARATDSERLTQTGALVGSPQIMAPEQFGKGAVDERCDVWALGVILYLALTGEYPFAGETLVTLTVQIAESAPASPRSLEPAVPRAVEQVCLRALEKDPNRRPANAAAFADALEAALAGDETGGTPQRALALVLGLALVAAPILWFLRAPGSPTSETPAPPAEREARDAQPRERKRPAKPPERAPEPRGPSPALIPAGRSVVLDDAFVARRTGEFLPGDEVFMWTGVGLSLFSIAKREPRLVRRWEPSELGEDSGAAVLPGTRRFVLVGASGRRAWVGDLDSEALVPWEPGARLTLRCFAVARRPGGGWSVAVAGMKPTAAAYLSAFDPAAPRPLTPLGALEFTRPQVLTLSPSGRLLFLCTGGGGSADRFWAWDVERGAVAFGEGTISAGSALGVSDDDRYFGLGTRGGLLFVYDTTTGRPVDGPAARLFAHANALRGVVFSSDSSRILTVSRRELKVFDRATGEVLHVEPVEGEVTACARDPHADRVLISTLKGGIVRRIE
jgi:hypothetical protein